MDASNASTVAWDSWGKLVLSCWAAEESDRPSMDDLHRQLLDLLKAQNDVLPEMRDIGALVSNATPATSVVLT